MRNIRIRIKNSIVMDMLPIMLVTGLLIWLVAFIVAEQKIYMTVGVFVGVLLAMGMIIHMYLVLDTGLSGSPKDAKFYVTKHTMLRYFIVVLVMVGLHFSGLGNPIGCFFGIMTIKAAAYLQPFYHKKRYGEEEKQIGECVECSSDEENADFYDADDFDEDYDDITISSITGFPVE